MIERNGSNARHDPYAIAITPSKITKASKKYLRISFFVNFLFFFYFFIFYNVYISIVDAESEGNGFDMEFGNRNSNADDDIKLMDVSQFVIGRIKLYAKNTKYRTDIIEGVPGSINQTNIFFETELDKNGQEIIGKDGCPKLKKVVQHVKVPVTITNNAAS